MKDWLAKRELTSLSWPQGWRAERNSSRVPAAAPPPVTSQETLAPCHAHDSALASAFPHLLIF